MHVKEHIQVLLSFSKKERRGIYLLLSISLLLWALPFFFSSEEIPENVLHVTPLEIGEAKQVLLKRKGLANFQHSGAGVDNKAGYGRVSIAAKDSFQNRDGRRGNYVDLKQNPIDINNADSISLERLPGIGQKLSSRIIRYRDRLGGFVSVSQLIEVYGLTDSVVQLISPMLFVAGQYKPKKIDVNRLGYQELRTHPYIQHDVAKALLAYRNVHGRFSSIDDVYNIISVGREKAERLSPYLTFND